MKCLIMFAFHFKILQHPWAVNFILKRSQRDRRSIGIGVLVANNAEVSNCRLGRGSQIPWGMFHRYRFDLDGLGKIDREGCISTDGVVGIIFWLQWTPTSFEGPTLAKRILRICWIKSGFGGMSVESKLGGGKKTIQEGQIVLERRRRASWSESNDSCARSNGCKVKHAAIGNVKPKASINHLFHELRRKSIHVPFASSERLFFVANSNSIVDISLITLGGKIQVGILDFLSKPALHRMQYAIVAHDGIRCCIGELQQIPLGLLQIAHLNWCIFSILFCLSAACSNRSRCGSVGVGCVANRAIIHAVAIFSWGGHGASVKERCHDRKNRNGTKRI
mmetsp:Transcript_16416/g.39073  ORF Transcript_16416/g.39073 Transcript_16416/m.39073 type:complete len:335 (+) Transcript_16416:172-1176(+)